MVMGLHVETKGAQEPDRNLDIVLLLLLWIHLCPGKIELVVFGPKAQELIGTPIESLIAADNSGGFFLPMQITTLYGKCFQMRLSVSPYSMQSENIIYQIDSIIGTSSIAATIPEPTSQGTVASTVTAQPENQDNSADDSLHDVPAPGVQLALPDTEEIQSNTQASPSSALDAGKIVASASKNIPKDNKAQKRPLQAEPSEASESQEAEKTGRSVSRRLQLEDTSS